MNKNNDPIDRANIIMLGIHIDVHALQNAQPCKYDHYGFLAKNDLKVLERKAFLYIKSDRKGCMNIEDILQVFEASLEFY